MTAGRRHQVSEDEGIFQSAFDSVDHLGPGDDEDHAAASDGAGPIRIHGVDPLVGASNERPIAERPGLHVRDVGLGELTVAVIGHYAEPSSWGLTAPPNRSADVGAAEAGVGERPLVG